MVDTTRCKVQPVEIVRSVGDEVVVRALDETRLHRVNRVEGGFNRLCDRNRSLSRMGKLNFDIDEASLLKTYGLSTLAPTYVSPAILRLAIAEHRDPGNGKILIMSWTSRLEGP